MIYLLILFALSQCLAVEIITGSNKFEEVRFQPDFVDKTLLIKEFLNYQKPVAIAAPDGFGKTTNLDMMRSFLNIDTNRTYGGTLFGNTLILKDENFINEMGNYSVLYCSLKPDRAVMDYKSMVQAFRSILFRTFAMHPYLPRSRRVTRFDKKRLTCYTGKKKHERMTPSQILVALQFLSKLLKQHHERDVILTIDDYDSMLLDSLFTNQLDHETVLGFHNAFLSPVIHQNEYVSRILLCGTTCTCLKPLKQFDHIRCSGFLEDETFRPFFGITESEVDELLGREEYKRRKDQKENITKWYGGYRSPNLSTHIYNTRSTLNFLKSGQFKSYWFSTRASVTIKYLLIEPVVQQLLNDSLNFKTTKFLYQEGINATDFKGLKSFTENELWDKDYADLFLRLLMEKGYFTYAKVWPMEGKKMAIKIPNTEICKELEQINAAFLADPVELLDRLKEAVHQASFTDVTEKAEIDTLLSKLTEVK